MSDDLEHEDTILSTALSRAIDSQRTRETPFERSRVLARMSVRPRSILTPLFAVAAAIVLGLTLGAALLAGRGGESGPVATEVSPSPSAAPTPSLSATPTVTVSVLRQRAYFARDQLPPIGVLVDTVSTSPPRASEGGPVAAAARTKARLDALATATAPPGTMNIVPSLRTRPKVNEARIDGDLVTVDYTVPNGDWGAAGSAGTLALIQQLIYTASEEPGVRRVLITENGGKRTIIDQAVIDGPRTRDDIVGYSHFGTKVGTTEAGGDAEVLADVVDWRGSVDEVALGLGRFVVELRPTGKAPEGFWVPRFTAKIEPNTGGAPSDTHKWLLRLELPDAVWPATPGEAFHCCPLKAIDKTPIRTLSAYPLTGTEQRGVGFGIGLDDARPWRVTVLQSPLRVVVDVGGVPQAVSESIAVYAPLFGTDVAREFTVIGLARSFEANVQWRLKDRSQVVAQGNTTASIGTSPVWGGYTFTVRVPSNVTGFVTLEVFWGSPKDGSEQGTVRVPLRVR